jgi:hypothetical protein
VGWFAGLNDRMAQFQYVFGLMPTGRHRRLARRLFDGLRKPCDRCAGEGVLTKDQSSWLVCGTCEGTGGFWVVPEDEVARNRSRILAAFPEAEARSAASGFPSAHVIHALDRGEMVTDRSAEAVREAFAVGTGEAGAHAPIGSALRPGPPLDTVLVYRIDLKTKLLVFGPLERARDISQVHVALLESRTWGQFRTRIPAWAWDDVRRALKGEERDVTDNEPFSQEDVPGVVDGDFPPWLQAEQADFLPWEILLEYGRREWAVLNGPFWHFDPADVDEIVADIREAGYQVIEADAAGAPEFF